MSLFIPTYFSPISQYSQIVKTKNIYLEVEDNFEKQSYRNRCYIYSPNGKQLLTVPIKHKITLEKKKTKDVLVENSFPWQKQHLKSLQVAYRSSPFYEFYEDDIMYIFTKKYKYLYDVNIDAFLFMAYALEIDFDYEKTSHYITKPAGIADYRNLADIKKQPREKTRKYIQMFDNKYGFISNLSILDLLFMEGPNMISYLL